MPSAEKYEQAAELLEGHANYRILRRIGPMSELRQSRPVPGSRVGVAIDVETTGLNPFAHKIIELAVQRFRFDEAGRIVQIGLPRVWREDPGEQLDPLITKLTGLSDADLKGQSIDEAEACEILSSADLIVAHNARFDRPFVEDRLPSIAGKAWACSMAEPDWLDLGFDGRALGHLLAQCGWFYDGHRAENDVLALIHLLSHQLPNGSTVLSELVQASATPSFQVNATGAHIDRKDRLKTRGYNWDGHARYWTMLVPQSAIEAEKAWLEEYVYEGFGEPEIIPVTACERYRK